MIRKPHNLITEYWDDAEYFLAEAEKMDSKEWGTPSTGFITKEVSGTAYYPPFSFWKRLLMASISKE